MSGYFTESNYENAVLQLLNEDLGYTYVLWTRCGARLSLSAL